MTIRQQGGIFGRNPTFNNVTVDGVLTVDQIAEKTGAAGITLDGVTLKDGNIVLASGKGIDFSATSGAGTSELFDDYEEGTFTPGLSDGTTQATFGSRSGRYTKIGDTVTVHISLVDINTTGLIAGALIRVTGLPFTAISSVFSTVPIWFAGVTSTSGNIVGLVNGNTTLLTLGNGTIAGMTNAIISQITSGSGDIYLTATYNTAL
jgi:hypothetical protein